MAQEFAILKEHHSYGAILQVSSFRNGRFEMELICLSYMYEHENVSLFDI